MNQDAHTLLTALGEDGYLSVCCKLPGGPFTTSVSQLPIALMAIDALGDTADIWYGVNRMAAKPASGRGTAADITRITCLFADLDTGKPLTPGSITEARTIIDGLPEPAWIVYSGHGLQPIWPLTGDEFNTSDPTILDRWGQLITDRCAARGWLTDNVYDLARILRVPGSINHKDPAKPVRARLEATEGTYLTWDEVTDLLDEHERSRPERRPVTFTGPARPAASNQVVREWLDKTAAFQRPATPYGAQAVKQLLDEYGTRGSSRHDWMVRSVTRVLELAVSGDVDAHQSLDVIRDKFVSVIAGERPALPEFVAGVAWGVGQIEPGTATAAPPEDATAAADGREWWTEIAARHQIIDWKQLWNETPDDEDWIVEPLIAAGRSISIYSPPKVGKSLLVLEITAAIASGRGVLGQPPAEPRRILYVDMENSRRDLLDRLIDLGYHPDDLGNLAYLSFPNLRALDSPEGGQEIQALALAHNVELVVIDTVSRVISGGENDADTFAALYRYALMPLKGHGIAVIRIDHSGKDMTKGQRGSSAKNADVDAVWILTGTDGTLTLRCEMSRTAIGTQSISLHRRQDPLRHEVSEASGTSDEVARVIAELDKFNVHSSASIRKARETGAKFTTAYFTKAQAARKVRFTVSDGRRNTPEAETPTAASAPSETLSGNPSSDLFRPASETPETPAAADKGECFGLGASPKEAPAETPSPAQSPLCRDCGEYHHRYGPAGRPCFQQPRASA